MSHPKPFTATGKPTKRTAPIVQRILQATEMGATRRVAAQHGGIGVSTLYSWMQDYQTFRDMMDEAEAKRAVRWLARIEAASETSWTAAAWKLERLYPEEYGRKTRTEIAGDPQSPLRHEHGLSEDSVAQIDEVLERLSPSSRAELREALIATSTEAGDPVVRLVE